MSREGKMAIDNALTGHRLGISEMDWYLTISLRLENTKWATSDMVDDITRVFSISTRWYNNDIFSWTW
jgi:hypothetical protein